MVAVAHWPLTYSQDTPRFTSDHTGIEAFFDDVDKLGTRTTASERDRIHWACRYAGAESESWKCTKAFTQSNATFTMFRDQVRAYYPHLDPTRRFTFHDLDLLIRRTQAHSNMTREDFGRYYRSFIAISSYLKRHHDLSDRECGHRYLDGFPQPIRTSIASQLLITRHNVVPSNGYALVDIQESATFVFAAGVSPLDGLGITRALNAIMGTKPRGQPSLIATIIDTDSTPTWTTYETHYPDSKRVSSADWEGANTKRTSQDLVDMRKASARRPRFHNQNLVFRRAAVANKKEADPTPRTRTSGQALRQVRTGRAGSLPRHPRPNWSSGR